MLVEVYHNKSRERGCHYMASGPLHVTGLQADYRDQRTAPWLQRYNTVGPTP